MRTGANFARGSCRALKWMLVLGVLLVMGSAQAAAQTPSIETASYDADAPTVVNIKMSADVFFSGGNADPNDLTSLLASFELTGGTLTEATAKEPIRISGLPFTIGQADDEFTLVFRDSLTTHGGTAANPLVLTYEQNSEPDVQIHSLTRTPLGNQAVVVAAPKEATALSLILTDAQEKVLEHARKRGTAYLTRAEQVATPTAKDPILLPRATGVAGTVEVVYDVVPDANLTTLGLAHAPPPATADAGQMLTGTLMTSIGSRDLEYRATAGGVTKVVVFTINVADVPDTPVEPTVAAASPSSLKVTWKAPYHNNSAIIGYELQYRPATATSWPADTEPGIIRVGPVSTYMISGLAPGEYDVRVRALNMLDMKKATSAWSPEESALTGAGPGTPTLVVDVEPSIPEGRNKIPVTITATVPPSAKESRSLKVTLKLTAGTGTSAEVAAELPNQAGRTGGLPYDLTWDSPVATNPNNTVLTLAFNSNLSTEATTYLTTIPDTDAEDEAFSISAGTTAEAEGDFGKASSKAVKVVIEDAETQVYELRLPVALQSLGEIKEGNNGEPETVDLIVDPARTVPKSFFVQLESAQDASDYSLTTRGVSSGGPSAVSLRVDVAAGDTGDTIMLTSAANDGDRVNDTITLQLYETSATSPTTAGTKVADADVMLKVVDQHKLPTVSLESITVDAADVGTTLMEGTTGTVTLMANRGSATDDITDTEAITVTLTHGAASSASAADYSLSSDEVTIAASGTSGMFMLEVLADDEIDAEELVLQAAVTGVAMYGEAADMVDLGPISFMDGTTKLVYPKTDEEIQAVIYPAKEAGMGDDMMFNPGEMIEIASPGSLFNAAEGVTLSYTAMSDMEDVATVAVSGGMVTVTAQDMAGVMAHITITAHASMAAAGAKGLPQTDPSEASIAFPVEVGLEAVSFMLSGPEGADADIVEGSMMGAMVTATASRMVTEDTTVMLMRDRAKSTAGDMDYMLDPEMITIMEGEMMGSTMVTAVADDMMEHMDNMPEELVLYGMTEGMAGEVTGEVKLRLWDAAVPALPLIAQLLLGLFLAIGGYRRYLRR